MSLLHDWSAAARRWLAAVACVATLVCAGAANATPSYMSYFGLGWNIGETQDHVNLYWAVSWDWDGSEILSEVADAKRRGMRAIVHTEFALFNADSCPFTLKSDAAASWASFAQALSSQGLLDTVAAFYPVDEPDLCGLPTGDVLTALNIIRGNPLTAGKPIAVTFSCDIAKKYGGPYNISGAHKYGDAVRAYDWVGVDCYGVNIFTDSAWTSLDFDFHCLCFKPGPSYYDNFKAQLNLSTQAIILMPQGFLGADSGGLPDDPQLFASQAAADPAVVLMAPFTWFDESSAPGVRSQPALAQQWRSIGRSIALTNPPNANPPLPPAVPPRLQVGATDVQHFFVYDLNCNTTDAQECAVELHWHAVNGNLSTQLFLSQDSKAQELVSCGAATSYIDIPWISVGSNFTFYLYQLSGCPTTVPPGATPVAGLAMSLATQSPAAATVVEFYNASLDHYFITWAPDEIAKLDAGTVTKGWSRTGKTFNTYPAAQADTSPVCRFYIPPALGDSPLLRGQAVRSNAMPPRRKTPASCLKIRRSCKCSSPRWACVRPTRRRSIAYSTTVPMPTTVT